VANKNTGNARSNQRKRQQNRQRRPSARAAAAARARQRQKRHRLLVSGSAAAVVLAIVAALIGINVGSNTKDTKGKPCHAVVGPLPAGAPAVPIPNGPPPTKLVTKDLTVGTGAVVTASQTLTVDYIGVACSTGKIFDSSYKTGKPAEFALTGVIPGWTQGIPGMKVGGSRLLGIPPALAYGAQGSPPDIGPNETLWFVVHVVSVK
jgi:peptidylprolyl isomerase